MGKDHPGLREIQEEGIADDFQIVDIILEAGDMGDGGMGQLFHPAGPAVAPLVIGDDGKMIPEEGINELGILKGILGEAMEDENRSDRGLRIENRTEERKAIPALQGPVPATGGEKGQDRLRQDRAVVFGGDEEILAEIFWHGVNPFFMKSLAGFIPDTDTIGIVEGLGRVHRDGDGTVSGYVENEADAAHVRHHIGSSIRKEGQGDTGDGHETEGHGDVFQDMEKEHAHDAADDEAAELVAGIPGEIEHAQKDQNIAHKHGDAADEAPGFTDG
jgi:hypothetical protein